MTYEQLRERLRRRHSPGRAMALGAAAVVGVAGAISFVWLGPLKDARGLRNPAEQLSAAQAEEPIACPSSSPVEGQSPKVIVLAFTSLRPTLP